MRITKSIVFKNVNDLEKISPGLSERFKEHMNDIHEPVNDKTQIIVLPRHLAYYLLGTEEAMYYYFDRETGYAMQEYYEYSLGIL